MVALERDRGSRVPRVHPPWWLSGPERRRASGCGARADDRAPRGPASGPDRHHAGPAPRHRPARELPPSVGPATAGAGRRRTGPPGGRPGLSPPQTPPALVRATRGGGAQLPCLRTPNGSRILAGPDTSGNGSPRRSRGTVRNTARRIRSRSDGAIPTSDRGGSGDPGDRTGRDDGGAGGDNTAGALPVASGRYRNDRRAWGPGHRSRRAYRDRRTNAALLVQRRPRPRGYMPGVRARVCAALRLCLADAHGDPPSATAALSRSASVGPALSLVGEGNPRAHARPAPNLSRTLEGRRAGRIAHARRG